jgi:hypothetical protein
MGEFDSGFVTLYANTKRETDEIKIIEIVA